MSTSTQRGAWDNRRVVVTGGSGFLGSRVVEGLKSRGCRNVFVPRRIRGGLRLARGKRRTDGTEKLVLESHIRDSASLALDADGSDLGGPHDKGLP